MNPRDDAPERALDGLFEELVESLETDPRFDADTFLAQHPADSAALRLRLRKLQAVGLLPTPPERSGVLERIRRLFGVAADASLKPSSAPGGPGPGDPLVLQPFAVVAGRYRLEGEIGRGGMGRILRAFDTTLRRNVAVKLARTRTEIGKDSTGYSTQLERFLLEAQVTGQLEHPNIVPVHDLGLTDEDRAWFAMRLVEGRTLRQLIDALDVGDEEIRREYTLPRKLQVILRVCDALAYAHDRGVVHRDLKPANVMIGRFGEVQVMDWGLAKLVDREDRETHVIDTSRRAEKQPWFTTQSGERFGTPSYMSPEQARGEAVDERADVFGIGAMLYHLLSGRPPYAGSAGISAEEAVKAVLERAKEGRLDDPAMARARGRVPGELVAVCRKALAAERAERSESVSALARDLEAFLEDLPGEAWSDSVPRKITKSVRRHPVRATISIAVLMLVTLSLGWWVQTSRLEAERTRTWMLEYVRGAETGKHTFDGNFLDYPRWSKACLARLKELGLEVDSDLEPEELAGRYRVFTRDELVAEPARQLLFELAFALQRAGALYLYHQNLGEKIPRNPKLEQKAWDQMLANYSKLESEAPELIELWPKVVEVMDAVFEDDPWAADFWEASLAWYTRRDDHLQPLLDRVDEVHGEQLIRFSRLVTEIRGREAAVALLERGVREDPSVFWGRFDLGRYYGNLGSKQMQEAEKSEKLEDVSKAMEWLHRAQGEYEAAISLGPTATWPLTNLGIVYKDLAWGYRRQGREESFAWAYQRAFDCYQRVLDTTPADTTASTLATTYTNLANLVMMEDPVQALEYARRAVELAPEDLTATRNLAVSHRELGNLEGELEANVQYAERRPEDPYPYTQIALIHRELAEKRLEAGEPAKAAERYELALAACDELEARGADKNQIDAFREQLRTGLVRCREAAEREDR